LAKEGITPLELRTAALDSAGKSIAYIAQRARGRRVDAAERRTKAGSTTAVTVVPIDPVKAAEAELRRAVDNDIEKARNDCDTLGLIEPEERDRRIAAARQRLATAPEAVRA
jgi:hypothetical protein